jgi:hypothetical protein
MEPTVTLELPSMMLNLYVVETEAYTAMIMLVFVGKKSTEWYPFPTL